MPGPLCRPFLCVCVKDIECFLTRCIDNKTTCTQFWIDYVTAPFLFGQDFEVVDFQRTIWICWCIKLQQVPKSVSMDECCHMFSTSHTWFNPFQTLWTTIAVMCILTMLCHRIALILLFYCMFVFYPVGILLSTIPWANKTTHLKGGVTVHTISLTVQYSYQFWSIDQGSGLTFHNECFVSSFLFVCCAILQIQRSYDVWRA